ncbi:MAG: LysE family transporter [Sneathiella sp.]|nr:LysE family transporter [Sneathiella sp.]
MTPALFSLVSLIFLAAITPGPNNFIVLGLSAKKGIAASLLPIVAILLGTQFVLLLTRFGFEAAFNAIDWLRPLMVIIGCGFLLWASIKMIFEKKKNLNKTTQNYSFIGLFFFQILNPKTWVLVGTSFAAFSAMSLGDNFKGLYLGIIILIITTPCLVLWAFLGRALKTRLSPKFAGKYLQVGLGLAMMASAFGLMTVI